MAVKRLQINKPKLLTLLLVAKISITLVTTFDREHAHKVSAFWHEYLKLYHHLHFSIDPLKLIEFMVILTFLVLKDGEEKTRPSVTLKCSKFKICRPRKLKCYHHVYLII